MNDLDLLKRFRAGLAEDPDQERVAASWLAVQERMGPSTGPAPIRHHRARRRWVLPASVAAAVAALLFALPAILPSGAPGGARTAAAVAFRTEGRYIVAVIRDPQADSEELRSEFAQQGLDISLQLLPVSPSFVGKFVFQGDSGDGQGPAIETLFDPNAGCTTPGGLSCPIGLKIPVDYQGHADLALGRAAQPGETYASANDAYAPGEALHCSGLRGMTVDQALPLLARLGVTAVWRSNDPAVDNNGKGIDPSTIAAQYVNDAVPVATGQAMIWVQVDRPVPPEPGSALATYFARLDAGC
jgi:hypothetical protein